MSEIDRGKYRRVATGSSAEGISNSIVTITVTTKRQVCNLPYVRYHRIVRFRVLLTILLTFLYFSEISVNP